MVGALDVGRICQLSPAGAGSHHQRRGTLLVRQWPVLPGLPRPTEPASAAPHKEDLVVIVLRLMRQSDVWTTEVIQLATPDPAGIQELVEVSLPHAEHPGWSVGGKAPVIDEPVKRSQPDPQVGRCSRGPHPLLPSLVFHVTPQVPPGGLVDCGTAAVPTRDLRHPLSS